MKFASSCVGVQDFDFTTTLTSISISMIRVVFGDAPFNYEISLRVQDNIRVLLQKVTKRFIFFSNSILRKRHKSGNSFSEKKWMKFFELIHSGRTSSNFHITKPMKAQVNDNISIKQKSKYY